MRRRAVAASLVLPLALASCGSKGSVAVSAAIDSPTVAVLQASALAAVLAGGFNLHLELGAYAPSGTDVTPGPFSLVTPSNQSSLLVLHLTSPTPKPYHLEPGATSTVVFTIADQDGSAQQMATKDELTALCQARTVQITGSITDSASRNSTPVTSSSFDVTGCP